MDTVNNDAPVRKMPKNLPISRAQIPNVHVTAKCSIATTARLTTMKIKVHRSITTNSCSLNVVACVAVLRN